jgi:nicotinamide riboside transporter PnuC
MSRTAPSALRSLIVILVIAVVVIAIIVAMISVGLGYVPSWALLILIASFILLVIVRIIAMAGFGFPPYDFSRLYQQNKEEKEKKK